MQKPPRITRLLRYYLFRTRRLSRRQLGTLNDWKLRAVFWVGAILVGVVVQLFAWAADFSAHQFDQLREWNVYAPLLVTPLGLVMIVWLMNHSSPAARGSGIPQVLVVLKQRYKWLRPAFLSIRVVLAKFALTCFGLMCGGSLGREGPSVHIGAALMHRVGQWGRLEDKYVDNALIVAGGAAGVSAAFNAPLAGVVFAIEELSQSFEQRTTGTLIVAIILSGVVVLAMAGHYSFFGQPEPELMLIDYWLQIIATAVVCGLLGGLFVLLLMRGSLALAPQLRKHPYRVALACGLLVALIGFLTGGITFGSGYDEARALIEQDAEPGLLFPLAKMASTLLTYFTGVPGGLFSPSLATGAGIGAFMGHLFEDTSVVGVTLVGMAAFLAGVTQRPITAFVIVMELTGNHHEMLLSLMAAAFIATAVAKLVHPTPMFDSLAQAMAEGRALPVEGAETAAPKGQKSSTEAG